MHNGGSCFNKKVIRLANKTSHKMQKLSTNCFDSILIFYGEFINGFFRNIYFCAVLITINLVRPFEHKDLCFKSKRFKAICIQ